PPTPPVSSQSVAAAPRPSVPTPAPVRAPAAAAAPPPRVAPPPAAAPPAQATRPAPPPAAAAPPPIAPTPRPSLPTAVPLQPPPAQAAAPPPLAPSPRQTAPSAPPIHTPLAPVTPPPPAPDELGILLKEYRPKRWALRLGIAVAVFLTGVAIIVYYVNTREVIEEVTEERNEVRTYARYTVPEPIRHAGDWMAVLGAFAVLYYLVWTLRTLNLRVAVHERGFVYRRWFRRIACPWTDIAKVYYFRQRQALVFSWTTYYC